MDDLMQIVRSVADPDKVDPVCSDGAFVTLTPEELAAFAQLVAKKAVEAEREACAKVCLACAAEMTEIAAWGAEQCTEAIRARTLDKTSK